MTTTCDLQEIPGVGPSIAADLIDLGVPDSASLRGRDPQKLYDDLCEMRGTRIDPCVLYVFRCACYFVDSTDHDPELLKWWHWKDRN